jgi:hypothetical protein
MKAEADRRRRGIMFARQIQAAGCALEAYRSAAKTSGEKDLVFDLFVAPLHREFIAERALKRFRAECDRVRFGNNAGSWLAESLARFDISPNGKVVVQL